MKNRKTHLVPDGYGQWKSVRIDESNMDDEATHSKLELVQKEVEEINHARKN